MDFQEIRSGQACKLVLKKDAFSFKTETIFSVQRAWSKAKERERKI